MKYKGKRIALGALILLLMGGMATQIRSCAGPGCGEAPPHAVLFSPVKGEMCTPGDSKDSSVKQRQLIVVNDSQLDSEDTLSANVFGKQITIKIHERGKHESYYNSWVGSIAEDSLGHFIMVKSGGLLRGQITIDSSMYDIKPCINGKYELTEVDLPFLYAGEAGTEVDFIEIVDPGGMPKNAVCNDISTGRINVLVLYTSGARDRFSGTTTNSRTIQMNNEVFLAITQSNNAFSDAGVTMRLWPVHIQLLPASVGLTSNWDSQTVEACDKLTKLEANPDVKVLRKTYMADLVSLWVKDSDSYGCGNLNMNVVPSLDAAYSVVRLPNATSTYTFTHEIGHNLGLRHECSSSSNAPFAGHGYYGNYKGSYVRSIMARNPSTASRLLKFSDPGKGFGCSSSCTLGCLSNEASVLKQTTQFVCNYRCSSSNMTIDPGTSEDNQTVAK